MKRITLVFAALMAFGLTGLQAQSCAKMKAACAAKKTSVAQSCHGTSAAAAQLASLDETIESRKCEQTGKVSYVRKDADPATGQVVFTSVNYDAELGKFVNVSPTAMKACCDKDEATGCCSKGLGTAMNASLEGKAKCSSAAVKAHCAKTKGTKVAEVESKPVKTQKGS